MFVLDFAQAASLELHVSTNNLYLVDSQLSLPFRPTLHSINFCGCGSGAVLRFRRNDSAAGSHRCDVRFLRSQLLSLKLTSAQNALRTTDAFTQQIVSQAKYLLQRYTRKILFYLFLIMRWAAQGQVRISRKYCKKFTCGCF